MTLDQWARDHKRRKLKELRAQRKYRLKFKSFECISIPKFKHRSEPTSLFTFGKDEGSKPSFILPGEVQQKQQ